MWLCQRQVNALEDQVLMLQADLGARESEISELKLDIELANRIHSRGLTSKDAEIAELQQRITKAEKKVTRLGAQSESRRIVIDKLTKRRSFVSIRLFFCYLRAMH
jgi:multidrug resistance efflux pump